MPTPLQKVHSIVDCLDDSEAVQAYEDRHGIQASSMLTVLDDHTAELLAGHLADRVEGRVVVEIGAGLGLLGCHLGRYARHVYCIEANPVWTWVFAAGLYHRKPRNVSFLLGAASEFSTWLAGDVALFCTHSGVASMSEAAGAFAPVVIDVYGELIAGAPHKFDFLARTLRSMS